MNTMQPLKSMPSGIDFYIRSTFSDPLCWQSLFLFVFSDLNDPAVVEIANKGIKVMADIVPITQQI